MCNIKNIKAFKLDPKELKQYAFIIQNCKLKIKHKT